MRKEFSKNLLKFTEKYKNNETYTRGLILLDLVNKLLNLNDLTTNAENYGFIVLALLFIKPSLEIKIVDFYLHNKIIEPNQNF